VEKIVLKLRKNQEFMTLNTLLKLTDIIPTGGAAKYYLMENVVLVNSEEENRRGRKLYPGDEIKADGMVFVIKKP